MPSYKIVYFNARGAAEISRLVLAAAGAEYEDERVEREDWPSKKPGKLFYITFFACCLIFHVYFFFYFGIKRFGPRSELSVLIWV